MGVDTSSAGFCAICPCSRWLLNSALSAASLRALVLGASSRSDSAATYERTSFGPTSSGASPRALGPLRELLEVGAVGAHCPRGRVATAQILVQQLQRAFPDGAHATYFAATTSVPCLAPALTGQSRARRALLKQRFQRAREPLPVLRDEHVLFFAHVPVPRMGERGGRDPPFERAP